ncbi:hypothetical protein KY327_01950 [Candidatus Woesearchaeota archaeon]|nr:hypothetical protein [Candidatus Woesearchaeota archaeon]
MTETYNNYGGYTDYTMADITTLQLSRKTKERLDTFGTKRDTYDDIINKVCDMAAKEQFRQFVTTAEKGLTPAQARQMIDEQEE